MYRPRTWHGPPSRVEHGLAARGEKRDDTPCHGFVIVVLTLSLAVGLREHHGEESTLLAAQTAPPDPVAADPEYAVARRKRRRRDDSGQVSCGRKVGDAQSPCRLRDLLQGREAQDDAPTGEVRTHEYRAGDVTCGDAHSHLPENVGGDTEFVQFHLKNRKSFDHLQTEKPRLSCSNQSTGSNRRRPGTLLRPIRERYGATGPHQGPRRRQDSDARASAYCIVEIRDMETGVKAGDSSCGDAMAHESPNIAKSVNEAITIEFKNRDRFKP